MNFYNWLSEQSKGKNAVVMDGDFDESKHKREGKGKSTGGQFRPTMSGSEKVEFNESNASKEIELPNGRKIPRAMRKFFSDENGNLQNQWYSRFLKKQKGNGTISREFAEVLDRLLLKGEDVADSEIEGLKEWKEALEVEQKTVAALRNKYGVERTIDIETPERNKLRESILKAAMTPHITKTVPIEGLDGVKFETNEGLGDDESYDVEKGHTVCIAIGLPAAGKSTTFANPLAKKYKARLCDSDTIKKVLPEFANGYGGNLVHDESTLLNEEVLRRSLQNGDNVVYPILGFKPDKLKGAIDFFHDNGYKVKLCFKDMPSHIAKGRMLVRFLEKGRYLPLRCISKAAGKLEGSFNANKGLAEEYQRRTGDPYGGNDTVLENKGDIL